ncbi:MAG: transcription initiation factor IIB [Candidatus Bathyarchaeota archaeon]|nr:MAG: transcription initiation factor IIB [Candidatus Bathyarchaeota archaeon]
MKNHKSARFLAKKPLRDKTTQKRGISQRPSEKCPECSSTNLIHDYDTGETICGGCGLVLRELMMDKGPEWRAFTQEEKASRSRVGVPTSYSVHDKGLSTAIGRVDRDAFGRKLPLSTRLQMWRLRKWQIRSRVHSSVDRNLAQAMAELDRLSDKTYIPGSVKEKAAVIYRKALDKGLVRGRSIAAIAAASLYAACRTTGTPRTLREIAEASFVDKKDVARCYRLLLRELRVQMPIADPLTYVSKIAERTGISGQTQGLAIKILHEAKRKRAAAGKDPMGLAAAALYIACLQRNEKKTQKDIAEAAGVTEVTVRNRYKSLKRQLGITIPD